MQAVTLQAIPNQQFSLVVDESRWDITVRTTNDTISVSIMRDGVSVIENYRIVSGVLIIPAKYQESGNFILFTKSFEIPDYTKFGVTQSLFYISAADLELYRAPTDPPITAEYFDPIAALPLRFAPSGYTLA